MTARAYIQKLIRMRQRLVDMGVSKRNTAEVAQALTRLKRWIDFYPRATEEQVCRFIHGNIDEVMTLIPGKGSPAHDTLIEQLNTYTYGNYNED